MAATFKQGLCSFTLILCVTFQLLAIRNPVQAKRRKHRPVLAFFQGHCGSNYCEQVCREIDHEGYACACYHGYKLNSDGITCSRKKEHKESVAETTPVSDISINSEGVFIGPAGQKHRDTVQYGESVLQVDNQTLNQSGDNGRSDDGEMYIPHSKGSSNSSDYVSMDVSKNNKNLEDIVISNEPEKLPTVKVKTYDHRQEAPELQSASLRHDDIQNIVPYPVHIPSDGNRVTGNSYFDQGLFIGERCDEFSCENKGQCVDDGTEFRNKVRCDCSLGTVGERCEKHIEVRYPHFYGNSYLALPVLKNGYKEMDILIEFKPSAQYGLLFFSSEFEDARSDFFSITLIDGFVEFRYDCGTGMGILRSLNPVVMGEWNTLKILREDNMATLWLNNKGPVEGISKGTYSRLTLRLNLYLGGYDKMEDIVDRVATLKGFVGCVEQVVVNGYKYDMRKSDLVGDAQFGVNVGECSDGVCESVMCENGGTCVTQSADRHICLCPLGYGGESCQHTMKVHIPEFSGHSFLQYSGLGRTALLYLEIELVIKPTKPDGMILYNGYTLDRKGDFISLAMADGHLDFRFDLGTGPAVIRSPEAISLNKWHWIKISRTGREGILEVDDEVVAISQSPGAFTQLTLMQDLFIGGHRNFDETSKFANLTRSFDGCIQKLMLNKRPVKLTEDALTGVNIESCEHPCIGQPCLNGGECVPKKDVYTCHCPLGFTSVNCEQELDKNTDTLRFTGESFLMYTRKKVSKRIGGNKFDLKFYIRPESRNGLLFWSGQNDVPSMTSDYLALGFVDGALQFRYDLGSGEAVMSYNDTRLFNGSWHFIHAQRDKQDGYLMINDREIVEGSSKGMYTMLNTNKVLHIGGLPDVSQDTMQRYTSGYVGCLRSVVLAEEYPLELLEMAQNGQNVDSCANQT